jgi:hypothetical protein
MTAGNLAVCFLPSLFRLADFHQQSAPLAAQTDEGYQPKYKSAQACLAALIEHSSSLFQVSCQKLRVLKTLSASSQGAGIRRGYVQSSAMTRETLGISVTVLWFSL